MSVAWSIRLASVATSALVLAAALPFVPSPASASTSPCGDVLQRPWCDDSLSPDARADLLLAAMTQEEKISLLAGDAITPSGALGDTPLGQIAGESGHAGQSNGVPRLGIPPMYYTDGPAGVRQGQATALPSPLGLAATWDPGLANAYGAVIGDEAKHKGNDVVFGPTINIMRTPLNSRTFESYGEDPTLSGRTAVGFINGLQDQGVMANLKHMAVYNQEGSAGGTRLSYNAIVDERTLREIYLPQFEAAVKEANPASIMCSYNRVNYQFACENEHLLKDILKGEWDYPGYVLTDYLAAKSTDGGLNNGLDFEPYPGVSYGPAAVNATLAAGLSTVDIMEEHVKRILRTMFDHGMFDRPAYVQDESKIDKVAHAQVAAEVEENALTLLSNKGVLPLKTAGLTSVAVIGPGADSVPGGGGSATTVPYSVVTPLEGITKRAGSDVNVRHDDGSDHARAANVAKESDVAVVVVTKKTRGSLTDDACISLQCTPTEPDQDALIRAVAAANPNTIVVLETPGPVLTPWRNDVAAVLEAWYPGGEAGTALARVLFGDVDPGGRLPVTFPQNVDQLPTAGDVEKYPGVAENVHYKEGVLVGHRWYDENGFEPAFAFGHGLSYTTFNYQDLQITPAKPNTDTVATVSVTVTNTGDRPGIAVPQLYLGLPDPAADLKQPPKQLKGFDKISLAPGEARQVSFPLDERAFSYWSTDQNDWKVAPGCYAVMAGNSSRDLPAIGAAARGIGTDCGPNVINLDAQADLSVANLVATQDRPKETVLTAAVANSGPSELNGVVVEFRDGDTLLGRTAPTSVAGGATQDVSLIWDSRGVKGDRVITAVVDPDGSIPESNESNNELARTITVRGNKVTNGSFEQSSTGSAPDGWTGTGSGASYNQTGEHSTDGTDAVGITRSLTTDGTWSSDAIKVTAGESYSLAMNMKPAATDLVPQLNVTYLDSTGSIVGAPLTITTDGATTAKPLAIGRLTVPTGVSQLRLTLGTATPSTLASPQTAWVDDIWMW